MCIVIVVLAWLVALLKRAPNTPEVTATFLSNTNGAHAWPFVVVSFVNHERGPIQWHDLWVEEEGSTEHHAPVMNPNLPWISKTSLQSGDSEMLAVGLPTERVRWRICWDYSPVGSTNTYTAKSEWFGASRPEPRQENSMP